MQYYVDRDSARLLQSLRQYIVAGSGVLLLSGPHGSGKTELLEQFAQNQDTLWQLCRMSALENPSARILLARIARHFNIHITDKSDSFIDEQMREHFATAAQAHIPVVTIDNAERLDDESLRLLWRLAAPMPRTDVTVRIVLVGTSGLGERLLRLQMPCQQLDMHPLDILGVENYLRHRLLDAGYSQGFPFSLRQLKRIERESGGWIGRIDSVAHEILMAGHGSGWRTLMPAGLALLAIGVFVGLYVLRGHMVPSTSTDDQLTAVVEAGSAETTAGGGLVVKADANADSGSETTEILEQPRAMPGDMTLHNVSPNPVPIVDEAAREVPENRPHPGAPVSTTAGFKTEQGEPAWIERQPDANFTLQLMVASVPDGLIALKQQHEGADGPMAVAGFTQEGRTLYMLLQGSYASRAEAEQASVVAKAIFKQQPWVRRFDTLPKLVEIAKPFSVIPASPNLAHPSSTSTPALGAAWLWSRAPGHFTVQLMGSDQKAKLYDFVARNKPVAPLAVVRVVHERRAWYLLVMGEFASQLEAKQAISDLPASMSEGGPWPRSFASLQDQLVTANRGLMDKSPLSKN